ncbi:t-SNARE [Mycena alexandri]|uniref:t-SNARE n=1 Tax=Mycena alexandri TaxID=1745969 RepID=A0AAD6SAZ7_9AGAR|nr:t-SNARE [Mycena alexandri]
MPTDRAAAYRNQRQAGPTNGTHELATLNTNGSSSLDSMPAFLAEATSIQDAVATFNGNITRISALNTRALSALGDDASAVKEQLDRLVEETMALSTQLKNRITQLQGAVGTAARPQEREIRQNRASHVRTKFTEALQTYRQIEQEYQAKARQRVERQYRIVKPDATQDEISEAISGGGDQVFMQALTASPQYAQARSALSEVQSRAQDLHKMEQTLGELAELFSDMAILVQQQDETVEAIENTAIDVEANAAEGLKETTIAVGIARRLRQKRWICFIITLVVVIILAAVLAVELTKK